MRRAIAIYPGTFDPVHAGHLALARTARDLLGATVHLVPDAAPGHRVAPRFAFSERLLLVAAAVTGEPGLVADGRSDRLPVPTRTLDVVRSVAAESGERPFLLLSDEVAATLPDWEDPIALTRAARLVVFHRPGHAPLDRRVLARTIGPVARRVAFIDADLPDCSSTAVRAALDAGEPAEGCLPPAVREFLATLTAARTPAEIES